MTFMKNKIFKNIKILLNLKLKIQNAQKRCLKIFINKWLKNLIISYKIKQ